MTSRPTDAPKSPFEKQREDLVRDISISMEHVLQNINKLNRSLEGIIEVGNEFSSVEALWSHFESVMAKDTSQGDEGREKGVGDEGEETATEK